MTHKIHTHPEMEEKLNVTDDHCIIDKELINEQCLTQNNEGKYVPAIPLPFYLSLGRCKCQCNKVFWSEEAYRGHYALKHILKYGKVKNLPFITEKLTKEKIEEIRSDEGFGKQPRSMDYRKEFIRIYKRKGSKHER